MGTRILQAELSSGKTERAIAELLSRLPVSGFAPRVWVLLATRRQEYAFRERLVAAAPQRQSFFNVEFMNFYQLNARLLDLAAWPIRRVSASASQGLLRYVIADLHQRGGLETLSQVGLSSGFGRVVGDLIIEMKQNRVTPEQFTEAVQTPKDRAIARIYAQYQALLQRFNLADREGEGWLALEALEQKADLAQDLSLLLVDGYDLFTPVQAQLLAQLTQHVEEILITLTYPPATAPIGRRFLQSAERLNQAFASLGITPRIEHLDTSHKADGPLANLQHLLIQRSSDEAATNKIARIEVPDERAEAAYILRDIRAHLLNGMRPEQFLIANREIARYRRHFVRLAQDYGIPILCPHGEALVDNPAIAAIMMLLRLTDPLAIERDEDRGFRRREVLDLLRSPYLHSADLSESDVEALDIISRRMKVLGGRQSWLDALEAMPSSQEAVSLNENDPALLPLDASACERLRNSLARFMAQVSPAPHGTNASYAKWIEGLIGPDPLSLNDDSALEAENANSLHVLYKLRQSMNDPVLTEETLRDIDAIHTMLDLLHSLVRVETLVHDLIGEAPPSKPWDTFRREFFDMLERAQSSTSDGSRSGRVLITSVTEARGLPHDYVYVTGLSEGVFPARTAEDPLYLDSEREALQQRGVLLMTQSERADDPGLFLELVSTARESLILTRPTILDGKPWNPSFLWQMVEQALPNARSERHAAGAAVGTKQAATLEEAALAAAAHPEAHSLRAWLETDETRREYWHQIEQSIRAETQRMHPAEGDPYSGSIRPQSGLQQIIADTLGESHVWSASQLNEYATCPYRFFARRLLQLDKWEEPEEGMDVLVFGTVQHAILEATYQRIKDTGLALHPDNLEQAQAHLQAVCASILPEAPGTYGFLPTPLWDYEQEAIRSNLEALLNYDFCTLTPELVERFGGERRIFSVERRFGFARHPALRIPLNSVGEIHLRGAVDRIDQVGDALIVIDYKSGSKAGLPKPIDMSEGRNYQMLVYLFALEQIIRQEQSRLAVSGGFFLSIRAQEWGGQFWLKHGQTLAQCPEIQSSLQYLERAIVQMRQGSFLEQPTRLTDGKCMRNCEYADLCRIATLRGLSSNAKENADDA